MNTTSHIVDSLLQFWVNIFAQCTYLLDTIDVDRNPATSSLLPEGGKDSVNEFLTPKSLYEVLTDSILKDILTLDHVRLEPVTFTVTWPEPRLVPMFGIINECILFCRYLPTVICPRSATELSEMSCDMIQIKVLLSFLVDKFCKVCL